MRDDLRTERHGHFVIGDTAQIRQAEARALARAFHPPRIDSDADAQVQLSELPGRRTAHPLIRPAVFGPFRRRRPGWRLTLGVCTVAVGGFAYLVLAAIPRVA